MVNHPLFYALVAAVLFGVWPLIGRSTGLGPVWVASLVATGTAAVTVAALARQVGQPLPGMRPILVLLVAGALNGVGMLAYGKLVGTSDWDLSTYVPLVLATMVLVTALGGVIAFGESFELRKAGGVIAVLVAIWLLR